MAKPGRRTCLIVTLVSCPVVGAWFGAQHRIRPSTATMSTMTASTASSSSSSSSSSLSSSSSSPSRKADPATWFDAMGRRAAPLASDALASLRADGVAALDKAPIPNRKVEAWRGTNLNLLFGDDEYAAPAGGAVTKEDIAGAYMAEAAGAQLVFVDGVYAADLSDTSALAAGFSSDESFVGALSAMPASFAGAGEVMNALGYLPEISAGVVAVPGPNATGVPVAMPNQPPQGVTDVRTNQGTACFAALNQACMADAAVLYVDNGIAAAEAALAEAEKAAREKESEGLAEEEAVEAAAGGAAGGDSAVVGEIVQQVQVIFAASSAEKTISHPRLVVVAKAGARVALTQSFVAVGGAGDITGDESDGGAAAAYFSNGLSRVVVEDGARVEHAYVQEEAAESFHFDAMSVEVGGDGASHELLMACTGGRLSRVNYDATIVGAGGLAQIHTVMLASGKQSMDIHSSITHAAPDALSRQQQRNIVSDKAEAVFRGRIRVDQAAQGTDSEQLCRSLLLSDSARLTAMPSMEIIADQVSCAHGATVADLSPEELFYLQSRGFTKEAARAILIKATVFEFSSRLPCEKVKARISRKIDQLVPKMKERTEFEYSSL